MKTPEEMASEYSVVYINDVPVTENPQIKKAWLAGYKAAKDELREAVIVLEKRRIGAEKAVTNIKNAGDWVTVERGENE